ncbi:hypothetical protein BD779DRAFT_1475045 [Infundibulicybe gibba]|nr:hypothetical protein BD779DRAFT_1475045 [Infundibulicybe gibba]
MIYHDCDVCNTHIVHYPATCNMTPPKNDGFKNRQQRWYANTSRKLHMEVEDALAYSDLLAFLVGEYHAPPETRNTITDTPQFDIVYGVRKDVLAWAGRWVDMHYGLKHFGKDTAMLPRIPHH